MAEHVGHRPAVGDVPAQIVVGQAGDQVAQALPLVGVPVDVGMIRGHMAHANPASRRNREVYDWHGVDCSADAEHEVSTSKATQEGLIHHHQHWLRRAT